MDRPTSSLSYHEAERLWEVVRELKHQGKTIVFVSHRLEDVFALAERVTVLRDGHKVATEEISQLTPDRLVSLMVGRELHETRALTTQTRAGCLRLADCRVAELFRHQFRRAFGEM